MCRRKRSFHLYSPGVVRRSHVAARHVRTLCMARRLNLKTDTMRFNLYAKFNDDRLAYEMKKLMT